MSAGVNERSFLPLAMGRPFLSWAEWAALMRDDATARSLFFSNLLTLLLALVEHWPLKTVMFIYCSQNVIIGVFNVLRILSIQKVAAPGGAGTTVNMPPQAKYFLGGFFALHYGLFQFGYYEFIGRPKAGEWGWIWAALIVFFIHHLFSFQAHGRREIDGAGIGRLMFFPYLRIIPMHMTIILGGFVMMLFRHELADRLVLAFFMFLKTNADLKMHQVEHAFKVPARSSGDPLPER